MATFKVGFLVCVYHWTIDLANPLLPFCVINPVLSFCARALAYLDLFQLQKVTWKLPWVSLADLVPRLRVRLMAILGWLHLSLAT